MSNKLGCGFLEKVYENALCVEMRRAGLNVVQQKIVQIKYDGVIVGEYTADILVENAVLVELKAVKLLDEIHSAQCFNYLKATNCTLCLLINFGRPRVDIKRIILTADHKDN